jgi:hypothetical protein
MSVTDLLVIVGGIAAIVWVNWYFFVAGRRAEGTSAEAGPGVGAGGPGSSRQRRFPQDEGNGR